MELIDEPDLQGNNNGSSKDFGGILIEDTLRQFSRSLARLIPKTEKDLDEPTLMHVQSLLRDILETAYCTNLSLTHGAAALNSLCGLLEQCHVSSIPQIRALPYGGETWSRAFNIYLTRSENNKPKPLRRLLLVVTNLLLSHPAESEKILFIGRAVCTATQAIRRENVLGAIKPAIQALEHFLCRGVVDPLQIALVHEPHEITSFRVGASEKERAASRFTLAQISHSVQDFTLRVLEWVKYPDCAPAIGRFLSAFYKRFQAENDNSDDAFMEKRAMPVWIFPVKQSLEQNHEFLEAFETHILPSLLRLDSAGTKSFLDILPFDEIQRGNVGTVENVDIHLCVLVARIETELSAISTADHGKSNAINVEILGMSLLDHANPNVRIAALSLLVASQASAKPFSRKVLESFRQCIPMFHVEVNAKPRNEFIALAKKLCRRLLVATMSLSRSRRSLEKTGHKSNDCPGNNGTVEKTEQNFTRELLEKHLRFRNWYTWFLLSELRPTASYQSHITALKVLHSSLEEYVAARDTLSNGHVDYIEALNLHLPNGVVLRLFSDLLTDPFDDVRQFAYSILKIWLKTMSFPLLRSTEEMSDEAHEQKHVEQTLITSALMHRDLCDAEMIAEETGRADQADGVGRFYSLLYESSRAIAKPTQWHHSHSMILDRLLSTTEKEISIATHDLLKVVSSTALLGHLIALRYIIGSPDYFALITSAPAGLEKWKESLERLNFICDDVWEAVRDDLCFDVPERHDDIDDENHEFDIGTKDKYSFCWRALKESSLLMHAMITNSSSVPSHIREDQYIENCSRCGNLAFGQLSTLRHRGAFSTVSHTFAACCVACTGSTMPYISGLPKDWYKRVLECIKTNALAPTRRSAGIPAIITGILAAYPNSQYFDDIIMDLQAMADAPVDGQRPEDSRLTQVHALNSLKDIFTDARFGPSTEGFVADTLDIAASCLESQIWAIRNCGLMLFKALLKRLNGGTDTASTKASSSHRRLSHLMYEKYPNLPDLLMRLLRQELPEPLICRGEPRAAMQAQRVFPALEVIESSGIPRKYKVEILHALWFYSESCDWSIREKAAKTLSFVLDNANMIEEITRLLSTNFKSQNALHGKLLCLRFLLSRNQAPLFGNQISLFETILQVLTGSFEELAVSNPCPINRAAYLDVVADVMLSLVQSKSEKIEQATSEIHQKKLLPLWFALEESLARNPALALQHNALKRSLKLSQEALVWLRNSKRGEKSKSFQKLGPQVDGLLALDVARRSLSEENDLRMLRVSSSYQLRHTSDTTEDLDENCTMRLKNAKDPQQFDFALALQGYKLGAHYRGISEDADSQRQFLEWTRTLSFAASERSDLRTRTAAIFSIRGFFDKVLEDNVVRPKPDPELLEVYLALYDAMVDDDEDVRNLGARTVSAIFSVNEITTPHSLPALSLSPPAAKQRLLLYLSKSYQTSKSLCIESIRRLTGAKPSTSINPSDTQSKERQDDTNHLGLKIRPVAKVFRAARLTSTDIFVEERQNLYIDTVSEAESWAEVLIGLDSEAWSTDLASSLETWTVEGLTNIIEEIDNGTDESPGPTSKSEIFSLFTQVILTAKVIISRAPQISPKEKSKEHGCIGLLEDLMKFGRAKSLHDLLLDRISSVLEDAMAGSGC